MSMEKGLKKIGKKAMAIESVGKWVIGILILVIVVIGIWVLKDKGSGAIEFIKNLFRFGR